MQQQRPVEIVLGIYEAFARGDVPSVLAVLGDDLRWHEAEGGPYGGLHRGRDAALRDVLGPLTRDIPDFAATPEQVLASGGTVAVVARYTGTGRSTSRRLDLPVVHLWDVRGGAVVRFRQFVDTVKFLEVVPRHAAVR